MGIAIIVSAAALLGLFMIGMFVSERGPSHFDHMLQDFHERKMAKIKNELELAKIQFQALNAPMPKDN